MIKHLILTVTIILIIIILIIIIIIIYHHHLHHHFPHQILDEINCHNVRHHWQVFLDLRHLQIKFYCHNLLLLLQLIHKDFLANTPATPESPQINDFLTLLPEILKLKPRKVSKPKTHQTTQILSGSKLELERFIEKEKPK